jgi:hypothetical protein
LNIWPWPFMLWKEMRHLNIWPWTNCYEVLCSTSMHRISGSIYSFHQKTNLKEQYNKRNMPFLPGSIAMSARNWITRYKLYQTLYKMISLGAPGNNMPGTMTRKVLLVLQNFRCNCII